MHIFPAIDLRGGRCVRLLQGRADQETEYFRDPAEAARLWRDGGAEWVHVVDLDGAFSGSPQNWTSVEKIAATGMKVQLGGGIRTAESVRLAFEAGVVRVVLGTRAFESEDFVAEMAADHGEKVAVGIDARDGRVAVKGWVDTTDLTAIDLGRRAVRAGVRTLIYTDIGTDGMLTGPNFAAQKEMLSTVECNVIASGGVARREDIEAFQRMVADHPNLAGVIVGKALYEGRVELSDLVALTKGG